MRWWTWLVAFLIVVPAQAQPTTAMTFVADPPNNPPEIFGNSWTIYASGPIDSDAPNRFRRLLAEKNIAQQSSVYLDSPGGNLFAAMELGRLFRRYNLYTNVLKRGDIDTKSFFRVYKNNPAVCLRALGITGFQWLNGSFTEKKNPNDLDLATFLRRPTNSQSLMDFQNLIHQNQSLFTHSELKSAYRLDAYFVDMSGSPDTIVEFTRYFSSLFSHRRFDYLWKGMLRVELTGSAQDDVIARVDIASLNSLAAQTRISP